VAGGAAAGWNLACWALFRILIAGKMRALFSMAFGASAILLTSRAEARSGDSAADIYHRRNLWLLGIGLAHAFLLFWGDILYPYAVCALILFPFRKLPAKKLIAIGVLFIAFKTGWSAVEAWRQRERQNLAAAADDAEKAGTKPTEQESTAKQALAVQRELRKPSREDLENDARQWRAGRGQGDTPERRDTDTAAQEHSGTRCIAVQRQVAGRAFHLNGSANRHQLQHSLKCSVAHAGRYHEAFLVRRARYRERTRISFRVRFRWHRQSDIDCLACLECPTGRFLEMEGHGAFSDLLAACQF
jgi:hypothetical protein